MEVRIDPDAKKMLKVSLSYSYIGIFFGVAVALGVFGGRWLDRRFHFNRLFEIVGLLFGVAAGFRELYRISKQYQDENRT